MEKKKKVLHLVEAFGGGVFTFLTELSNSLADDYEVVIAYSKRSQLPEDFKKFFDSNIKFIEVNNFSRNIGLNDLKACKEVAKIVKEESPDIVHMHSAKASIIGRLAINGENKKLFYTPHGYSFLKEDDSKIKRTFYKSIEKAASIYRNDCKVVACSEGEYKEALKLTKNSTYVNNGINIEEIQKMLNNKEEMEIDVSNLKICTVGRIDFQKNPEVFNKVAEKFPDNKFTWIGDGVLKDKLKSPNIEITGWLTRTEAINKLWENDVFLLPSLWEGLPIALLEAMYLGKICVVSNVIGNRDVIKNGNNGFVCNKLSDYCNIIKRIKNNEINLNIIKRNAINDVIENYNMKKTYKKYKENYES